MTKEDDSKNQRDKKEVFDYTCDGIDPIYGMCNRWPHNPRAFRTIMESWRDACTELSLKLLEGFCLGLDLPPRFLHEDFEGKHTGFVRLNYYPTDDPMAVSGHAPSGVADLGIHHLPAPRRNAAPVDLDFAEINRQQSSCCLFDVDPYARRRRRSFPHLRRLPSTPHKHVTQVYHVCF